MGLQKELAIVFGNSSRLTCNSFRAFFGVEGGTREEGVELISSCSMFAAAPRRRINVHDTFAS
jgi:hypothetical protein